MRYPGLFNSSYVPSPEEILIINSPQNFLGPMFIGQATTTLLQGVFCAQYYEYVSGSEDQRKCDRWLVHITACLTMLKLAYVWWVAWEIFVAHFGDWTYLVVFNPLAIPTSLFDTVPTAVCQIFYIQRGWTLSKNKYFVGPAILVMLFYIGSGIAVTWNAIQTAGGQAVVTELGLVSSNAAIISGLVCNLFITGFTCWYLVKEMTGTRKTDNLVKKVIRISIETATGPTIVSLLGLILANNSKNNEWFLFPALATSHVYGCSLLYIVNSRKRLNGMMENPTITSNFFRPTIVEAEVPPPGLIAVESSNVVEPESGRNQIHRTRGVLGVESEKIHIELTPQSTEDYSAVDKDKQGLKVNSSR